MCGIVCLFNFSKDISDQENNLKAMTHLLRYRGPNDTGEYISSHILMGHKRLSIIDLKNGKQPMQYKVKNKLYTITYNGEIYNMIDIKKELVELGYTFKTTSDTEVILAAYDAYKEQCAEKIARLSPDGKQMLENHIATYGEILLHILAGELITEPLIKFTLPLID